MSTNPIVSLWRGEVSLARVFWEYMIGWATLLNLIATGLALASFLRGAPAWLGLLINFSPIPLNAFLLIAVWRAAAREEGSGLANFARFASAIWFAVMIVA